MLKSSERAFIKELEHYLAVTLQGDVRSRAIECPPNFPAYLKTLYNFYEIWITGLRCIMIVALEGDITPAQVAKHVDLVRTLINTVVIFVTPALDSYNRSRLIAQRVAFVVPNNQVYIPELAADLREHFRQLKEQPTDNLSPAAQAVLFHYILRINENAETPSVLAKALHYSVMSISRAFDDLVAFGLAHAERHGKERCICFDLSRKDLFKKSLPLLRSPVRSVKSIRNGFAHPLKWAGESALSKLTDLSPPQLEVFAVAASKWKAASHEDNLMEIKKHMASFLVETWSYDPTGLSDTSTVDPLSLYVQFYNHQDERLSIAAESLLDRISW